jgi:hypothetical protein
MSLVAPPVPGVSSPTAIAALLLTSIPHLRDLGLTHPTATEVLAATHTSRSRAYALKARLEALLVELVRPVGRPPASPPTPVDTGEVSRAVLDFVMEHPGCIHLGRTRRRYSDTFRCFILDLIARHPDLDLAALADAARVPLGTLKDWLRGGREAVEQTESPLPVEPDTDPTRGPQIETILTAWKDWTGSFIAFCDHVQRHLRIPCGRTMISRILEAGGVRIRKRRPGRTPDESALRGQFETFFPGAQWSADGSPIQVTVDGETYSFNLELEVDTHTAALVGMSLRDNEDEEAVVGAFRDGVTTSGEAPIAQLLDNRPSNHTNGVKEALGDTMKIPRTLGRPQNGAHVEGAFGLFQQTAPPVELDSSSPRELARQVLALVVQIWARTLNHRPRPDRGDRSRVEQYRGDVPTPEEVKAAHATLAERLRKQETARETRRARLDPQVSALLDEAFESLDLLDPERHIRDGIATYPLDAILPAIAIYETRARRGTLPEGVDARYLQGIVRRIAQEDEGVAITDALLLLRLRVRDAALRDLQATHARIESETRETLDRIPLLVDAALATDSLLDRHFWLSATADLIRDETPNQHGSLLRKAARRIHATHRVPHRQRLTAARRLASMAIPLS